MKPGVNKIWHAMKIYLLPRQYEQLLDESHRLSKELGRRVTLSEIVREALDDYMEKVVK